MKKIKLLLVGLAVISFTAFYACNQGTSETEEPTTEEPAVDEPAVEEPTPEEPAAEEPATEDANQ